MRDEWWGKVRWYCIIVIYDSGNLLLHNLPPISTAFNCNSFYQLYALITWEALLFYDFICIFWFCLLFFVFCFYICVFSFAFLLYIKSRKNSRKKTQLQFAVNLIVAVINFIAMKRRKSITSSNNYIKIIIANILPLITTLHTKLIRFHSNCWLSKISFYDNVFHLLFNDKILNFLWSIFIMAFPIIFIIVIWIMIALFMASWRL